ncbi:ComEA family DNA-binding protein [Terracidiphilus gabretensis]|uniref:ComEA family DNA-binding protein n=1 Tax=Terracidiphilus gabretensis TaxID=1577687 RepID=UPI00071BD835|nr:helix-hairpin-helix domain-containing protein [Terracidiphilus gabretensis]
MWRKGFRAAALLMCVACCAASSTHTAQAPTQSKVPEGQRLDVNRAGMEELMKLPGITQIWAERIIRFRPYHAKSDLRNQGVIPARTYHKIEDLIVAHRN